MDQILTCNLAPNKIWKGKSCLFEPFFIESKYIEKPNCYVFHLVCWEVCGNLVFNYLLFFKVKVATRRWNLLQQYFSVLSWPRKVNWNIALFNWQIFVQVYCKSTLFRVAYKCPHGSKEIKGGDPIPTEEWITLMRNMNSTSVTCKEMDQLCMSNY